MANIAATNLNPCLVSQTLLAKYFGKLAAESNKPFTGVYDALVSPMNKISMSISEDMNNGQAMPTGTSKRKLQIRYVKPACDEACGVEVSECDIPENDQAEYGTQEVIIDDFCSFGFTLNEEQFLELCEDRDTIHMDNLMTKFNQFLLNVDKKLINLIKTKMGTYPSDGTSSVTAPKSLPFKNKEGLPNVGAWMKVSETFQEMGYTNSPIWIGDKDLNSVKFMQAFLATNNQGVDLSKLSLDRFFYDAQLNKQIDPTGDDKFVLTWIPGTFQFIDYSDNKRRRVSEPMELTINDKKVSRFKKQIDVININGINLDFYYEYDCGKHKFNYQKRFGIFSLPQDSVCENHYPALAFKSTCGDVEDCQTLEI